MKMALLAESIYQAMAFYEMQKLLSATIFYQDVFEERENTTQINWNRWEFGDLLDYDTLVVFNGWGPNVIAQTHYLREAFANKKFFYTELAWFPQKGHIYLDPAGVGGRSTLSQTNLACGDDKNFEELTSRYPIYDKVPYENFILVPLQREEDTSILYDSPAFKTMYSLLSYVKKHFPDFTIVARVHPLWPYKGPEIPGVIFESEIPTLQLAQHARLIVGINSTSMFESLQFFTPTIMLGRSVLSGTPGIAAPVSLTNPRNALEFVPDRHAIRCTLSKLFSTQFNIHAPKLSDVSQLCSSISPLKP